ncbi:MAG: flippase [Patescibacteria group bacterium]|jgi:O-antigen/teichoic acid export membrane protein
MSEAARKIAKNTGFLTGALIIQKAIAFLFFLLIARYLGDAGTGEYVGAFAFSSLFSIGVDVGLSQVLIREIARHPEETEEYYRNTLGAKIFLGTIVYSLLLLTVFLLGYFGIPHPSIHLVAIAGIIMLADSFVLTGISIFRGWQNLWFESVVIVVQKVGVFALGALVLLVDPSPQNVAYAILGGGVVSYVLLARYLGARIRQPWRPAWNVTTIKKLMTMALPFAVAGFFSTAYAQLDSVLLSTMQGNTAVGLYSVAAKTMNAFAFIPAAFMAALYPAMSNYFVTAPDILEKTLERSLRYLLVIGAPIAVGLFILADSFVVRLGAAYAPSAASVRILLPSLIFVFLSYPLGALMNATNHQHWQTMAIGVSLIVDVICNIFWIPRYSYLGASAAWFLANACYFFIDAVMASHIVKIAWSRIVLSIIRVGFSVIVMAAVVKVSVVTLPLILLVLAAAIIYIIMLFVVREVSQADIQFVVGLLRRGNVAPVENN